MVTAWRQRVWINGRLFLTVLLGGTVLVAECGAQSSDIALPISEAAPVPANPVLVPVNQEIVSPEVNLRLSADVVTSAMVAPSATTAAPPPDMAVTTAAATPNAAVAQNGDNIYRRMAASLQNQGTFFVELLSTNTIVAGGRSRVSGGLSRVWYRRPDHVVWTTQSDIGSSALALNTDTATLFLPSLSKYTVSPVKEGDFEGQVAAMSSPYGLLATAMFSGQTQASLEGLTVGPVELIRSEEMLGVICDRLRLPTSSGPVDLWVAQGSIPLPVMISSTMSIPPSPGEDNGVMSRTDVSFRWKVNVELADSTFQLKLPDNAVKVTKLGGPIDIAKITAKKPDAKSGKSKSGSDSRARSAIVADRMKAKGKDPSGKDYGLAFDPPPNLSTSGNDKSLPSLSGDDDVVARAIRGSRPDSVPSGVSYQPQSDAVAPPAPASSAKSPRATLKLLDGKTVDLGAYRGRKAVVLDFWATWCGPCKQSMPAVAQVAQSYRVRGVEFFAVNMAEDSAQIQSFINSNGMAIPVATDADGRLAKTFGVGGIPHLVVIGKDGTVVGTHTGADSGLAQSLSRDLESALR